MKLKDETRNPGGREITTQVRRTATRRIGQRRLPTESRSEANPFMSLKPVVTASTSTGASAIRHDGRLDSEVRERKTERLENHATRKGKEFIQGPRTNETPDSGDTVKDAAHRLFVDKRTEARQALDTEIKVNEFTRKVPEEKVNTAKWPEVKLKSYRYGSTKGLIIDHTRGGTLTGVKLGGKDILSAPTTSGKFDGELNGAWSVGSAEVLPFGRMYKADNPQSPMISTPDGVINLNGEKSQGNIAVDKNGVAMHGVSFFSPAWDISEPKRIGDDMVVTKTLDFKDDPACAKFGPGYLEITYRVGTNPATGNDRLRTTVKAKSTDPKRSAYLSGMALHYFMKVAKGDSFESTASLLHSNQEEEGRPELPAEGLEEVAGSKYDFSSPVNLFEDGKRREGVITGFDQSKTNEQGLVESGILHRADHDIVIRQKATLGGEDFPQGLLVFNAGPDGTGSFEPCFGFVNGQERSMQEDKPTAVPALTVGQENGEFVAMVDLEMVPHHKQTAREEVRSDIRRAFAPIMQEIEAIVERCDWDINPYGADLKTVDEKYAESVNSEEHRAERIIAQINRLQRMSAVAENSRGLHDEPSSLRRDYLDQAQQLLANLRDLTGIHDEQNPHLNGTSFDNMISLNDHRRETAELGREGSTAIHDLINSTLMLGASQVVRKLFETDKAEAKAASTETADASTETEASADSGEASAEAKVGDAQAADATTEAKKTNGLDVVSVRILKRIAANKRIISEVIEGLEELDSKTIAITTEDSPFNRLKTGLKASEASIRERSPKKIPELEKLKAKYEELHAQVMDEAYGQGGTGEFNADLLMEAAGLASEIGDLIRPAPEALQQAYKAKTAMVTRQDMAADLDVIFRASNNTLEQYGSVINEPEFARMKEAIETITLIGNQIATKPMVPDTYKALAEQSLRSLQVMVDEIEARADKVFDQAVNIDPSVTRYPEPLPGVVNALLKKHFQGQTSHTGMVAARGKELANKVGELRGEMNRAHSGDPDQRAKQEAAVDKLHRLLGEPVPGLSHLPNRTEDSAPWRYMYAGQSPNPSTIVHDLTDMAIECFKTPYLPFFMNSDGRGGRYPSIRPYYVDRVARQINAISNMQKEAESPQRNAKALRAAELVLQLINEHNEAGIDTPDAIQPNWLSDQNMVDATELNDRFQVFFERVDNLVASYSGGYKPLPASAREPLAMVRLAQRALAENDQVSDGLTTDLNYYMSQLNRIIDRHQQERDFTPTGLNRTEQGIPVAAGNTDQAYFDGLTAKKVKAKRRGGMVNPLNWKLPAFLKKGQKPPKG